MAGGNTFCMDWDDTIDSFCAMGLQANLLRGIYSCAPSLPCIALPVSGSFTHKTVPLSLAAARLHWLMVAESAYPDRAFVLTRCKHANRCFFESCVPPQVWV